ncbi:MAG: hypothetical protein GEU75_05450 [Dehalococcoidia bacterium]|nr:hypothetical protein [Dehalococcoidia bacterium]
MLNVFLSRSGGSVLIPDAVAAAPGDTEDEVKFIDAAGRALVIFRRQDVVSYSNDGQRLKVDDSPETSPPV